MSAALARSVCTLNASRNDFLFVLHRIYCISDTLYELFVYTSAPAHRTYLRLAVLWCNTNYEDDCIAKITYLLTNLTRVCQYIISEWIRIEILNKVSIQNHAEVW